MQIAQHDFPCRFGSYVLVSPLGVGGMGNVFLALLQGRPGVPKLCVLKRLTPEDSHDAEKVARFRREAEIASRLSHGAIAQTISIDQVDDEPFIVQEFLDGRTLAQAIEAGHGLSQRASVPLAVHVVREVARALAYAHREDGGGVIHRDVSPHNIMLTFGGEVRLIDFGIARRPADPSLTQAGLFVGRRSYAAPEILHGKPASPRTDIYSLGVVLWELLADAPAWESGKDRIPAPSSVAGAGGISRELDAVVLKAVAQRPEDRFQSGEAFQEALGACLPPRFVGETAVAEFFRGCYDVDAERRRLASSVEEAKGLLDSSPGQVAAPPAAPVPRRRMPLVLGALGAAVALAVAVGALRARRGETAIDRAPAPAVVRSAASRPAPIAAAPATEPLPVPSRTAPATAERLPRSRAPEGVAASRVRARPMAAAADALLTEANASLQMGELADAEREARQAISEGTPAQRAQAHAILGEVLLTRERPTEAGAEFREALRLDPSNAKARKASAQLRGDPAQASGGH